MVKLWEVAIRIRNLDSRCRWVLSLTLRPLFFFTGEMVLVSTGHETSRQAWTLCSAGSWNIGTLDIHPVTYSHYSDWAIPVACVFQCMYSVDQKYFEKFWNVLLEDTGEDHLDRSCEKWRLCTVKEGGTSYIQWNEGRLTGLVTFCVGTAFWNTLLKEIYKGREDEEEDVSSCWMALREVDKKGKVIPLQARCGPEGG